MSGLISHSARAINQLVPLVLCQKVLFPASFDSRQLGLCPPTPFQRQQQREEASKRTVGGRGAVTASRFLSPLPGLFSALSVSHFCRGD
ncbi:hypothetical protein CGRA01v4_05224 [Colletotrichum graminicola]|nr:hypothetical protein CGRA01v4_05224 [Colletotrichum graminicola]